jgi:hypothetical protein
MNETTLHADRGPLGRLTRRHWELRTTVELELSAGKEFITRSKREASFPAAHPDRSLE